VEPAGTGVDDRVELRIDADDCPDDGALTAAPACRRTAICALAERDADAVRVRSAGVERYYTDDATALLLAAGRFAALVDHHDSRLATTARTDPLAAAREATGRSGVVSRLAAETGLAEGAARMGNDENALRVHTGPTIAQCRLEPQPPADARLLDSHELPTGGTARQYVVDDGTETKTETPQYHLEPVEASFSSEEYQLLAAAAASLAEEGATGELAPDRAVRRVASSGDAVEAVAAVLRKHTRGNGVLDDLFADERVTDAFVTAPADENPLRVTVDGEPVPTNVRLTPEGVGTLASRIRRRSGRAFSRATPTVDATLETSEGEQLRVAGVTRPLSPGTAFAFRRHGDEAWTLPRLVIANSLTARVAALLSLAVQRGAAGLVAGARGAGKTTLLGALLWALPSSTRTVVIEDTPELPVQSLQNGGRDVQHLHVGREEGTAETTPAEALRTALRLGEGSLVVGEVRGEEAPALYEAMRVGAASDAVLGTVHGKGAEAVRGRMAELGVSNAAFGATDFVLTTARTGSGRQAVAVEEVRETAGGTEIRPLFGLDNGELTATGLLDRGESKLLDGLSTPQESYGDTLAVVDKRATWFRDVAADGVVAPDAIQAERTHGEQGGTSW
jgi:type IV secretory pathway ATPase VirB11/archaellum biosynthesis ATPase